MKRISATVVVALGAALLLTGCGNGEYEREEEYKSPMEICIEAGGDFVGGAWGDECYMQGAPDHD